MSNLIYFIYTTLYISFVKNEIYQIGQKPQKTPPCSMAVRTELSTPSSPIVTSPQEQTILKENKQNTKQTNRTNKLTTMSVQDPLHNLHNCFWKCFKKLKLPIFIAICHMSIGLELRLKFFCRRVEYRETSIVYLLIQTIKVIEDQSINKNKWTVQNCNYCLYEKWVKWGGGGGGVYLSILP